MKKSLILFLALIFLAPNLICSGVVSFRIGYFIPRADSDLWETEFEQMTFTKSQFQNTNFSFTYEYFFTQQISLTLGIDSYNKNKVGQYIGFVGLDDFYYDPVTDEFMDFAFPDDYIGDYFPAHTFNVSITPIQLSLKLTPLGRKGKFIPYIGGGIGFYVWRLRLMGDMIDFSDTWIYTDPDDGDIEVYPIYIVDARETSRVTVGYHGFGGVMVPVAQRFSLDVEFKYNYAHGELKEGFEGFDPFALGGIQISLGMNYWF